MHLQVGQCGNQIGSKVRLNFAVELAAGFAMISGRAPIRAAVLSGSDAGISRQLS